VAVLLDAASVRPDVLLLLDTFFHVVVLHGETIAAWREQGYHQQVRVSVRVYCRASSAERAQEEHANFRNLLEAPQQDAQVSLHFHALYVNIMLLFPGDNE
jgi:protein transport protein SEC23